MRAASSMDNGQVLALTQFFQEFLQNRFQESSNMFGQVPVSPAEPFLPDLIAGLPLPGGIMHGTWLRPTLGRFR